MSFLTNLFGEKSNPPPVQFTPSGFNAGGLSSTFSNNNYNVTADPSRTAAVGGLSDTFANLGNQTGDLRATVAPGFNDLLKSRLTDYGNQATAAIGNLKQNLQSRRILGSSFGQDTLTRANNTFAQGRDAITADNFQKSLEANNQLLTQQYAAYAKQFQTGLDELNLETGVASSLTGNASTLLAQNAQLTAKLSEQAQEANAKMTNNNVTGLGSLVGKAIGFAA